MDDFFNPPEESRRPEKARKFGKPKQKFTVAGLQFTV